jgi:hypothetical protein
MTKGKNPPPSPAEEFLAEMNPDKPFKQYWRRIPSRSDFEPNYYFRPIWAKVPVFEKN